MAHKKGQGSVKNGRDSVSKRLGVKEFGGTLVSAGSINYRLYSHNASLWDLHSPWHEGW